MNLPRVIIDVKYPKIHISLKMFYCHAHTTSILMDDNATPYQAKVAQQYKVTNHIANIDCLTHSPNCNPDDNIWNYIQWKVYKQQPPITNLAQLQATLLG